MHDHAHHHHDHGHDHGHAAPGTRQHELAHAPRQAAHRHKERGRLLGVLALTLATMAAEAVGGWLTHSLALLSDAGHMLTDASAILLSVLALYFGSRPANERKTFGYYRLEILAALVNGVTLIAISVAIMVEAWARWEHPVEVKVGPMGVVALVGLVANGVGVLWLSGSHNLNTRGVWLHLMGDLLASGGVVVAAVVMYFTGWWRLDPVISFAVSLIIIWGSWGLVKEAVDVLLEATPSHLDTEAVVKAMRGVPDVVAVHDLHVWTIATGMYALSAHLVVSLPKCAESDGILKRVKEVLSERFHIDHSTLQIESEAYAHFGEEEGHEDGHAHDHDHDHEGHEHGGGCAPA